MQNKEPPQGESEILRICAIGILGFIGGYFLVTSNMGVTNYIVGMIGLGVIYPFGAAAEALPALQKLWFAGPRLLEPSVHALRFLRESDPTYMTAEQLDAVIEISGRCAGTLFLTVSTLCLPWVWNRGSDVKCAVIPRRGEWPFEALIRTHAEHWPTALSALRSAPGSRCGFSRELGKYLSWLEKNPPRPKKQWPRAGKWPAQAEKRPASMESESPGFGSQPMEMESQPPRGAVETEGDQKRRPCPGQGQVDSLGADRHGGNPLDASSPRPQGVRQEEDPQPSESSESSPRSPDLARTPRLDTKLFSFSPLNKENVGARGHPRPGGPDQESDEPPTDPIAEAKNERCALLLFSWQLRNPWRGMESLCPSRKALAAVFALSDAGQFEEMKRLAMDLARLSSRKRTEVVGMDRQIQGRWLLRQRIHATLASPAGLRMEKAAVAHAWEETAMIGMLDAVSERNRVMLTQWLAWLRNEDPLLWSALNGLGRPAVPCDALAALVHFNAERRIGKPLGRGHVELAARRYAQLYDISEGSEGVVAPP